MVIFHSHVQLNYQRIFSFLLVEQSFLLADFEQFARSSSYFRFLRAHFYGIQPFHHSCKEPLQR